MSWGIGWPRAAAPFGRFGWGDRSGKLEVVGNVVFIFVGELGDGPLAQFAKDFPKTDDRVGAGKRGVCIFREASWDGDSASGGPVGEVADGGGGFRVESLCLGLERCA